MISNSEVENIAQNIDVNETIFTSAKNGQNVENAFHKIAEEIVVRNK